MAIWLFKYDCIEISSDSLSPLASPSTNTVQALLFPTNIRTPQNVEMPTTLISVLSSGPLRNSAGR